MIFFWDRHLGVQFWALGLAYNQFLKISATFFPIWLTILHSLYQYMRVLSASYHLNVYLGPYSFSRISTLSNNIWSPLHSPLGYPSLWNINSNILSILLDCLFVFQWICSSSFCVIDRILYQMHGLEMSSPHLSLAFSFC